MEVIICGCLQKSANNLLHCNSMTTWQADPRPHGLVLQCTVMTFNHCRYQPLNNGATEPEAGGNSTGADGASCSGAGEGASGTDPHTICIRYSALSDCTTTYTIHCIGKRIAARPTLSTSIIQSRGTNECIKGPAARL